MFRLRHITPSAPRPGSLFVLMGGYLLLLLIGFGAAWLMYSGIDTWVKREIAP